jgi:hypothetical protein
MRFFCILILLTLTSCRFGNRIEQQENPDKITGFYETALQSVSYCATTGSQVCANVAVSQVPSDFPVVMSNPVILLMTDLSSGSARLFSKEDNGYYLRTKVFPDDKLSYSSVGGPGTFWEDPSCYNRIYDVQEGSFTRSTGQKSADGFPLSGTLEIKFTHNATIEGSCGPTLQLISECYSDMTKCGGASMTENQLIQEAFQNFLNPYIQSGAMTASDIPNLTALGYEVTYQ